MTKKNDTLSYISDISREIVRDEIAKHCAKLEQIRKTLAEHQENIEDAIAYQQRGADWKRKEVMAECEKWMDATNCPHYLRADNLAKARESCDNAYIAKVTSAMFGLKLDLATEVEVTPNGVWRVAQSVADAMLERRRYTLTPNEVEAYRLYERLLDIAEQLHKRNYFMTTNFAGEDCLYRIEDEAKQIDHFLSLYVMTDAERKERIEKIGV